MCRVAKQFEKAQRSDKNYKVEVIDSTLYDNDTYWIRIYCPVT